MKTHYLNKLVLNSIFANPAISVFELSEEMPAAASSNAFVDSFLKDAAKLLLNPNAMGSDKPKFFGNLSGTFNDDESAPKARSSDIVSLSIGNVPLPDRLPIEGDGTTLFLPTDKLSSFPLTLARSLDQSNSIASHDDFLLEILVE